MADNSTAMNATVGGAADAINITQGGVQSPSGGFSDEMEYLLISVQVMLSAMGIIWLGSHASIRRPPSAAAPKKMNGRKPEKEDKFAEGLTASDAVMFPVLAGTVLVGLYYLIQWLQDPEILNKVLRSYTSIMSFACLGKLCADFISVLTTLIFPSRWATRSGKLYNIDAEQRKLYEVDPISGSRTVVEGKRSPIPGPLGNILPDKVNRILWEIRHLLTEEWTVRLAVHGIGSLKAKINLDTLLGTLLATVLIISYYITNSVMLSNLLGTSFSYTAFTVMSPTSFMIGTMVLFGLFFYDIIMVFYTPFMITVATKLDVPIKLVYQGHSRSSMLGLGDIVIPGIFIGLALRFDLYQYYQKQITYVPVELVSEMEVERGGQVVKKTETQHRMVKEAFVDPRNQWGNWIWSLPLRNLRRTVVNSAVSPAPSFPKPYFYASMGGYAVGMAFTLTMLLVFNHGQPALLYLVPGVTGAAWLTGLIRGELRDMWTYTEDGSLDTEEVVVELNANGRVIKEISQKDDKTQSDHKTDEKEAKSQEREKKSSERTGRKAGEDYYVFLFSVTAPRYSAPKQE